MKYNIKDARERYRYIPLYTGKPPGRNIKVAPYLHTEHPPPAQPGASINYILHLPRKTITSRTRRSHAPSNLRARRKLQIGMIGRCNLSPSRNGTHDLLISKCDIARYTPRSFATRETDRASRGISQIAESGSSRWRFARPSEVPNFAYAASVKSAVLEGRIGRWVAGAIYPIGDGRGFDLSR